MHGSPDHHDAELLLRLYELRREEKLRRARDWFERKFEAQSLEESLRKYPFDSEEAAYVRMTLSYWDMAASIVNHGLIQEQFFFENNGELLTVWEKVRYLVPPLRELYKNPHAYENLEKLALKYEKWMEERSPGHLEARRKMMSASAASAATGSEPGSR
jgi:hypothetical protein